MVPYVISTALNTACYAATFFILFAETMSDITDEGLKN